MKRRIVILAVLALAAGGPLAFGFDGASFDFFQVPYSPRAAALGGLHAALADDTSALFSNPAGFQTPEPRLTLASAVISIYDAAPSLIDQVITGSASTPSGLSRSNFNLIGPLSLAYVGNGLGFGVFTNTNLRTATWGPYPSGSEVIEEYLLVISGYAFGIPLPEEWHSRLSIGFSVPFFVAGRSDSAKDVRGLFASQFSPIDLVATQPFTLIQGLGIEAGLLYSLEDVFSVGIAARNLAATSIARYASLATYLGGEAAAPQSLPLPMDISFGVRWSPPIHELLRAVDELTFLLDYTNAFDFLIYPPGATNPLLHIGAGLELRMLEIVSLRAGFYQCLPSGGLSIDFTIFTLDIAVFGREATTQPWGYPVYGYMIGLTL